MERSVTLQGTMLIFVYGTLRSGASNHHRLGGGEFVEQVELPGELFAIDWYPGMVHDIHSPSRVVGEIYRVSANTLRELDEYEGSEYKRISVKVETSDGSLDVYLWEYVYPHEHFTTIEHGDWLRYQAQKEQ